MKILNNILLTTLLMSVVGIATPLIEKNHKKNYDIVNGTTLSQFQKKGLSVDLTYTSEHVEIDEVSNVDLNISTPLKKGLLKVYIKSLSNNLSGVDQEYIEFKVTELEKNFPLHFQVSASTAGIHYINLTFTMDTKGSRVIVVPVNIGKIQRKLSSKVVQKNEQGMNISVSQAEETIE